MGCKYILHYGNLAGWPYSYALALQNLSVQSLSVKPIREELGGYLDGFVLKNRQLPTHSTLSKATDHKLKRLARKLRLILHCLANCSLVHYYGGTILPGSLDAALFQKYGIPTIISWGGGDARIVSIAREKNPYFYRQVDQEWDSRVRHRLSTISRYVHFVATDPELAEYSHPYFKRVFALFQPINLEECRCAPPDTSVISPVILHIPTQREVKGTAHILAAIERLRAEGLSFEFRLLEPTLTQRQVKERIAEADIFVDELRCGSYGQTAVEAMASGKPTVTFIREDLLDKYPYDLPIVNANPDTVYMKLRQLIVDPELRYTKGIYSRKYVEKYHALEVVGPSLLDIYRDIGWKQ